MINYYVVDSRITLHPNSLEPVHEFSCSINFNKPVICCVCVFPANTADVLDIYPIILCKRDNSAAGAVIPRCNLCTAPLDRNVFLCDIGRRQTARVYVRISELCVKYIVK